MSNPYLGEIRVVGFNFAPVGWTMCDGQLLAISQYDALFALIGTTYGGDGVNTFALPNLQSRVAIHPGLGFEMGQQGGTETVTVEAAQMPSHSHTINAVTANGNTPYPKGAVFAASSAGHFVPVASATEVMGNMVSQAGGNQPHNNIQPYLALTCIIALQGIFPSQN
jgi:microcystin-dependent protein